LFVELHTVLVEQPGQPEDRQKQYRRNQKEYNQISTDCQQFVEPGVKLVE